MKKTHSNVKFVILILLQIKTWTDTIIVFIPSRTNSGAILHEEKTNKQFSCVICDTGFGEKCELNTYTHCFGSWRKKPSKCESVMLCLEQFKKEKGHSPVTFAKPHLIKRLNWIVTWKDFMRVKAFHLCNLWH